MPAAPIVAVEIGTSKVVAIIGELREDRHVMITGMGEHPSAGVRKGEIIDLENAAICLRAALAAAEETAKVAIRSVHLAITGGHIRSLVNRGTVPVLDPEGEITEDDIEEVKAVARAVNLGPDQEIIHTICQHFRIDDQQLVLNPEGMEGAKLSVDMLVLHGVGSILHNTVRVARTIPVEVEDVVFSGLCSALAVLTPEQKKIGVVVIDLGGGTTDYVAYAGNVLAAAGTLGVGGDHITNDIVLAFNIPTQRAERLKRESGRAGLHPADAGQRVTLPAEVGFPGGVLKLDSLNTAITLRVEEILTVIRKRLESDGILRQIGSGVVLTGGGAYLRDIETLAGRVFGMPCSIGRPINVSGATAATDGPQYATCSGLIQYGFRFSPDRRQAAGLSGWLKELFGR
jgi:cell division protein FtsA